LAMLPSSPCSIVNAADNVSCRSFCTAKGHRLGSTSSTDATMSRMAASPLALTLATAVPGRFGSATTAFSDPDAASGCDLLLFLMPSCSCGNVNSLCTGFDDAAVLPPDDLTVEAPVVERAGGEAAAETGLTFLELEVVMGARQMLVTVALVVLPSVKLEAVIGARQMLVVVALVV
jgi:hypothetical protein